jgi:16S rRNA (cytosine1402-N4)-methyltransferase
MHIPVLLDSVLEHVAATHPGNIVDGTVGGGGYIKALLRNDSKVKVLGIDLDQASLGKLDTQLAQEGLARRCRLVHGNFSDIKKFSESQKMVPVSAVILDLGFSSLQLNDPSRGFSFQVSGPLDMRFDQRNDLTAMKLVNEYSAEKLEQVFRDYSEERYAKRIARKIVDVRPKFIENTTELLDLIKEALPVKVRYKSSDSARRIFQGIRIEVNKELENLQKALPQIVDILKKGGRVIVISFHSLEDRIVKEFFKSQANPCVCPKEFPECVCGKKSTLKIITKRPIIPNQSEIKGNSRSRSAKLRVAEKI